MTQEYYEDTTFEKIDFSEKVFTQGNYERCTFIRCNFSDTNLSSIHFAECEFTSCNLSMAQINGTEFIDAKFIDCKLLWLAFENCSKLLCSFYFENCILNFASFRWLKIKKTEFKNCSIQEANFTETDITSSIFDNCDLARSIFERTILEKVNFLTSYNYAIDPEINTIKNAKFSLTGVIGLLHKYNITIV